MDVAADRRWTYDEAISAVKALVLDPAPRSHRIGPADVATVVRDRRETAAQRADAAERETRRRHHNTDEATMAARSRAIAEFVAVMANSGPEAMPDKPTEDPPAVRWALEHRCPLCKVAAGERCTHRTGGWPLWGRVHTSRDALLVPCGECQAAEGVACAGAHPCYRRDIDADALVKRLNRTETAATEAATEDDPGEESTDVRRLALRHVCPHCRAQVGQGCVTRETRPRPLRAAAHPSRIDLIEREPSS